MSGGDLSSTILRIYQTLAVEFQTARAEQIYITNRRYATNTPPLPPSSFLHPIPPPPLPSFPSLDPRETSYCHLLVNKKLAILINKSCVGLQMKSGTIFERSRVKEMRAL
jgi:hypothetical protein